MYKLQFYPWCIYLCRSFFFSPPLGWPIQIKFLYLVSVSFNLALSSSDATTKEIVNNIIFPINILSWHFYLQVASRDDNVEQTKINQRTMFKLQMLSSLLLSCQTFLDSFFFFLSAHIKILNKSNFVVF